MNNYLPKDVPIGHIYGFSINDREYTLYHSRKNQYRLHEYISGQPMHAFPISQLTEYFDSMEEVNKWLHIRNFNDKFKDIINE